MRTIFVIGIGTGNPDHMTLAGISALKAADLLFIPTKGAEKAQLAAVRHAIVARHGADGQRIVEFALPPRDTAHPDYREGVSDWHGAIAGRYAEMIRAMGADETAALLVWGDPGLYDSTLRILERARDMGPDMGAAFSVRVVPGITAISALTAAFGIALNTIGNPVTITTGRKLAAGWPEGADSVVVILDGQQAYGRIDPLGIDIYWAAYVGMEAEILMSGRLLDMAEEITAARAAARARHGWIMDIYLLRKAAP